MAFPPVESMMEKELGRLTVLAKTHAENAQWCANRGGGVTAEGLTLEQHTAMATMYSTSVIMLQGAIRMAACK
jgi:hypothetical protein